jgi:hypothetical protein
LKFLTIENNKSLNKILFFPDNLERLEIVKTSLKTLPNFNEKLRSLILVENQFEYLPNLPKNLVFLNCSENQLIELPSLPNLKYLFCNKNKLIRLPLLPLTLEVFSCDNNKLTKLPENIILLEHLESSSIYPNDLKISSIQENFFFSLNFPQDEKFQEKLMEDKKRYLLKNKLLLWRNSVNQLYKKTKLPRKNLLKIIEI